MKTLINNFPIQVGVPQRMYCPDQKAFINLVDKYNGIKKVYYSIYNVSQDNKFSNPKLSKIFFDFDGPTAHSSALMLVETLQLNNLKHTILFSGNKGYHVYIFTSRYDSIINLKDSLLNAQTFLIDETVNNNPDKEFVPDTTLFGDITQLGRVPNTLNINGDLYCIPVSYEDLKKGDKYVREMAKSQHFIFTYKGEDLLEMKQFDFINVNVRRASQLQDMPKYSYEISLTDSDKMIKNFPPCVQSWLLNPKEMCKNRTRYFFTLFCKDMALPSVACDSLARKYWNRTKENGGNRTKYHEFVQEKQIDYAYRSDNCVPNCPVLFEMGFCQGKCDKFKENNFPIYND